MSYRRALVFRWRRNDRLAVAVLAVTVAFLVGTVLFVFAAGSQMAALAAGLESPGAATHYGTPSDARAAAQPGDVVVPLATATEPDGESTVAGVPNGTDREFGDRRLRAGTTRGTLEAPATQDLRGETTVTVSVTPRERSVLPPSWYVVRPATVERLGPTGALVIEGGSGADEADEADAGADGADGTDADTDTQGETPLRGVLGFFLAGTDQLLTVVGVVAVGGGLLVGVTAYGATRTTVADRRETIQVVRATGAPPGTVLRLFGLRAALLGGVGVALGYAVGVIAANAAVNVAVAAGLPTSLSVAVTAEVAAVLAGLAATFVALATVGGLLAARRAATAPPAVAGRPSSADGFPSLRVLDRRALVPTAATLTAFLLVSAVFVAGAAVVAPVATTDGATVSEPGAVHPVASQVPAAYADGLRARGIDASGEILLFGVRNGEPVPMRGVDFEAFAALSGARIVEGRPPRAPDEAVIGSTLAGDVAVGETVTVGGSTRSAVDRVRVVGRYETGGADGAALLVSHRTARHLSTVGPGEVNVVRAERLPAPSDDGLVVTDVDPASPVAGEPSTVAVSLSNADPTPTDGTVTVRFGDQRRELSVALEAGGTTRRTVAFDPVEPGTYDLVAGDRRSTVRVVRPDRLSVRGVPATAPPGSAPLVTIVDATGAPAADVPVRVGDAERRTAADGTVRLPLNRTGTREIVAGTGETAGSATVRVREGAPRRLVGDLDVAPERPDVLVRPTATLTVRNPDGRARTRTATAGDVRCRRGARRPGGRRPDLPGPWRRTHPGGGRGRRPPRVVAARRGRRGGLRRPPDRRRRPRRAGGADDRRRDDGDVRGDGPRAAAGTRRPPGHRGAAAPDPPARGRRRPPDRRRGRDAGGRPRGRRAGRARPRRPARGLRRPAAARARPPRRRGGRPRGAGRRRRRRRAGDGRGRPRAAGRSPGPTGVAR
ncbi:ABC transporter permease [Halobacteriales archaeon QS_8_69_73]|nr:MAG: ABC transporter permease [Halobacteriales archaeon QS_8_69_73]